MNARLSALLFLLGASAAHAIPIECAEDKRTEGLFCFAPSEIRESGGIRTAPFYMGGPKQVDRTPYTIAANCATGVLHLKDKRGVSFGGAGPGEGTPQSRELRRLFCAASLPAPKKKK